MAYAQILKRDMKVGLIGGAAEGLPITHQSVICIDIGERIDIKVGMKYDEATGNFYEEIPINPEPKDSREQAYESMRYKADGTPLLSWDGNAITIDQANKVFLDYTAEGTVESKTKASQIQSLIAPAKAYIRSLYPDTV